VWLLPAGADPDGRDDIITVIIDRSEMGQGVLTSLAMLVAEELEVSLDRVRTEFAPAAPAYINNLSGMQSTGGSTSIRNGWEPLREAGATAREMLIAAAAEKRRVEHDACRAEAGMVIHPDGRQRLRYGALAEKASGLPVPKAVKLKDPAEFHIIGRPTTGLDVRAKVSGSAMFGIDDRLPGMLTAVVADNFWPASRGRERLNPSWDTGALAGINSAAIRQGFTRAAAKPGIEQRAVGYVAKGFARAARRSRWNMKRRIWPMRLWNP
jgi:isoquinoline 1-oxidoreductase beta subunit